MNHPKVPQFVANQFGLAEQFASCPQCDAARTSSQSTDAICFPHYVRMNQRLLLPGDRRSPSGGSA